MAANQKQAGSIQVEEKLLKKKKSFQQAKYSDYVIFLFYPQTHIRLFFFGAESALVNSS